jgi:hypothetical protein
MGNGLQIPFRLTLRPVLFTAIGILIGTIFFSYVIFQARFLIQGPVITLTTEPPTEQTEQIVTLEGTVKNITRLSLNGRQIFTDETGYFKEALLLENGYTIATIAATDRYGRETKVIRSFVYVPAFTNDDEVATTSLPTE